MEHIQEFLALLAGVKKTANGWSARCPAHDDQHPSLEIAVGDDRKILVCCQSAHCTTEQICAAVGVGVQALFAPSEPGGRRILAAYDYRDEDGELLFQVVRYHPKDFRCRKPTPDGGWESSISGVRRVLYRLPELLAADPEKLVFLPEGEKDVDLLHTLGLVATTNPHGAEKWREEYAESLRGRAVIILPDNDAPGDRHAQAVAASLRGIAASVRILKLDGLPEKGDVGDWLRAGGTVKALKELASAAQNFTVAAAEALVGAATTPVKALIPEWVWLREENPEEPESEPWEFPIKTFPASMQNYLLEASGSMGVKADYVGCAMLAAVSVALGASRAIACKADWIEPGILYLAIVGSPGSTKTPVVKKVLRPICDLQVRYQEEYEELENQYMDQHEAWEQWKKSSPRSNRPQPAEPPNPNAPPKPHIWTTNATTEFLSWALAENPRGMLLDPDELTGWIAGMNQYKGGKGADRQFFLSTWSSSPAKTDRKGDDGRKSMVMHPFLSVLGTIQPEMMDSLHDERGREDGFIHRFLFSYPERIPHPHWSSQVISFEALEDWEAAIGRLASLVMDHDDQGRLRPRVVRFDAGALEVWEAWYNQHTDEINSVDLPSQLFGPWSKIFGYGARLALLAHYLGWAAGENEDDGWVGRDAMIRGATLAEYFKSHIRKAYGHLGASQGDLKVSRVIDWLRRRHGGRATAREVIQSKVAKLQKTSQVRMMFKDLEERGFGKMGEAAPPTGHGHKILWFELNRNNGNGEC